MRYIFFILIAIGLVHCSNNNPKPKGKNKKVYVDTIYRFKPKSGKPIASSKKEVAEEDRIINITSDITSIKVKKNLNKMYVYFADTFKVFKISLGANPVGHKVKQGDNKTPEGKYFISLKNPNSRGYRSLKISYPNESDKMNAKKLNVNPGGDIFIHGLWYDTQDPKNHWKDNWTRGCIAVNNKEIEEIFNHCNTNIPIHIYP